MGRYRCGFQIQVEIYYTGWWIVSYIVRKLRINKMTSIVELSTTEALKFHVPKEIAENPQNRFYGVRDFSDMDGPWPFLAYVVDDFTFERLWIHICNIFPESLAWEEFNPLKASSFLHLKIQEFERMISISKEAEAFYFRNISGHGEKSSFRLLGHKEIGKFGLDKIQIQKSRGCLKKKKYYYLYEETNKADPFEITIVYFSWEVRASGFPEVFLEIMSYSTESLGDKTFEPRDHADSKICLDGQGMRDFVKLLSYISGMVKSNIRDC
jgi:hypothetical protein